MGTFSSLTVKSSRGFTSRRDCSEGARPPTMIAAGRATASRDTTAGTLMGRRRRYTSRAPRSRVPSPSRPRRGYNAFLNERSNSARGAMDKARLRLRVNGEDREVLAPVHHTLLEVLREELGLTGTKHGCELGECGTCTVLLEGRPVLSCLTLPVECEGRAVTTVEGLAQGGTLHPLQQAFAELGAAQCGYCTPGFLLVAEALLREKPDAARAEIAEALAGNLCRCTG